LINVDLFHGIFVFIVATIAMLLFAAATQGWFLTRSRFYESIALLLIAFTFFRPGFWMDMIAPPYTEEAPAALPAAAASTPAGSDLRVRVAGVNDLGDPIEFVALVRVPEDAGEDKLAATGISLRQDGDKTIIDDVAFGSTAADAGLDWDQEVLRVLRPADAPSKYWMFIPAVLLLLFVVISQRSRSTAVPRSRSAT
jgi:hypothetical protein